METETINLVEELMETLGKIVEQLKTQSELNKVMVEKIQALENYDYLEG